ncbi:hypothetical protein V6N12_009147 [Hibiscus sabdariffa]|uniref:Histidine-containing phosphotransfer protein n=1 Tax=Hibiscus sabdariffa TaxID=183260 RepID=A0ABR2C576_9ROSI
MVGTTLSQQLNNYIQTMHEQGILDYHFDHVKALQNEENPRFVMEVISMFAHDAEAGIAHLTTVLNSAVVDFAKVISFVHQLKGSSSSIGGVRMALACREIRHACDNLDKERWREASSSPMRQDAVNHRCWRQIAINNRNIAL